MAVKKIGHIVNTFGIKGQLKVSVSSSTAEDRFAVGKKIIILDQLNKEKTYVIKTEMVKNGRIIVIGLEGFDDINQITWMIGRDISAQVRPPKGTFFYDDLVGMNVLSDEGKAIGTVTNVAKMPAGDYLLVGNYYIPFKTGLFIESVDKEKKEIHLTSLGTETCK
jgi:16S rRNA processing protein RimM